MRAKLKKRPTHKIVSVISKVQDKVYLQQFEESAAQPLNCAELDLRDADTLPQWFYALNKASKGAYWADATTLADGTSALENFATLTSEKVVTTVRATAAAMAVDDLTTFDTLAHKSKVLRAILAKSISEQSLTDAIMHLANDRSTKHLSAERRENCGLCLLWAIAQRAFPNYSILVGTTRKKIARARIADFGDTLPGSAIDYQAAIKYYLKIIEMEHSNNNKKLAAMSTAQHVEHIFKAMFAIKNKKFCSQLDKRYRKHCDGSRLYTCHDLLEWMVRELNTLQGIDGDINGPDETEKLKQQVLTLQAQLSTQQDTNKALAASTKRLLQKAQIKDKGDATASTQRPRQGRKWPDWKLKAPAKSEESEPIVHNNLEYYWCKKCTPPHWARHRTEEHTDDCQSRKRANRGHNNNSGANVTGKTGKKTRFSVNIADCNAIINQAATTKLSLQRLEQESED